MTTATACMSDIAPLYLLYSAKYDSALRFHIHYRCPVDRTQTWIPKLIDSRDVGVILNVTLLALYSHSTISPITPYLKAPLISAFFIYINTDLMTGLQ